MAGSDDSSIALGSPLVGRATELDRLDRFLALADSRHCLVLTGEPGIGKTTLWEAGLEIALRRGFQVRSARAAEAETPLAFVALADLLSGAEEAIATLPGPQLHALEVALRRKDPGGATAEPFAISAAVLNLLHTLSEPQPLLIAIDDLQWLDHSSVDSLRFAARRLSSEDSRQVRFLFARRQGRPSTLEQAFTAADVELLPVEALSMGAIGHLLHERLGEALPRWALRQVYEVAQGNPLFALEYGRTLLEHGHPELGSELPVPDLVDDLFGERIRALPDDLREVLVAVALGADLNTPELSMVVDPLALEDALARGLIVADRSRLRPAHPLLGAAARRISKPSERRRLHARLAFAANVPAQRLRHLAIAAVGADADLADAAATAAAAAAEQGSVQEAEELAEHALRLTPPGAGEETARILLLARCHAAGGDFARVTELLSANVDAMPPGRHRAWAHLLLAEAGDAATEAAQLELAIVAAGDDQELRAFALARRVMLTAIYAIERIDQAEEWAREALSLARSVGGDVEARVKPALAWAMIMRGRQVDHLRDAGFESISGFPLNQGPVERPFAVRLAFRGEVRAARSSFERLRAIAEERGDFRGILTSNHQLCEVALRAGDVTEVSRQVEYLDQWASLEEMTMVRRRLSAVLAAVIGSPAEAVRWARSVRLEASSTWDRLEVDRALGLAALLSGDFEEASGHLTHVWEHTLREHLDDPGAFPVAGDLVEALLQSGHFTEARRVTETLQLLASEQSHPWGLATAKRSRAMIEMSDTFQPAAATTIREAAAEYGRMGLVFEQARSLLYLGRVERRYKQRAAARASIEEARSIFERAGCSGWAAHAEAELSRVSGRRGGDTGLTPSEQRVAQLAAEGLSNKEIAGRLVLSVNTVERHLSHAYSKLGVRGRAQLRSHLSAS